MSDENWGRLRELFSEVEGLTQDERRSFLDEHLVGEPALRAELEVLLTAHAAAGPFLAPSRPVELVGPYRLIEVLGEGGFGVVWLAQQSDPIRRQVALKLIKPGMDTMQVIARFETERQTLALMDHPGIAHVFEAGATADGRPYFAMEYVPGVPVTTYCDAERLDLRERLELFASVCDAVQHAHQKGVIHRDLKPGNVLVTRRDGVHQAKVIDFGIAKATAEGAPDATLLTREGMIVGTLGYMSPEQAGTPDGDVDTRSDIYSLGAVLYELLAGAPPFDAERLRKAALSDAIRFIREEEPPPLTARVTRSGEGTVAEVAARRSTDPPRLLRGLKGEVQWITMRALEKDPDRRYTSAAELASDIRRHLAQEPVLAGPPGTMYRARKYARRHRVGVAAGALAALSVVGGGIAAGIGLERAMRAERVARTEAETSRSVADFLVELFRSPDPNRTGGDELTVRSVLDEGARRIESDLEQDPAIRARLLEAMSSSYGNLGVTGESLKLIQEALAAADAARPRNAGDVARYAFGVAEVLSLGGATDSVPYYLDRAIAELRTARPANEPLLAASLAKMGRWWLGRGEVQPADSLLDLAIEIMERQDEPDPTKLAQMYEARGTAAHFRFDLEAAVRDYERSAELAAASGNSMWLVYVNRQLSSVYRSAGDNDKALERAQESVDVARTIYAPDHPNLADALSGLAAALSGVGRFDDAIAVHEECLSILRARGLEETLAHELNTAGILCFSAGWIDSAITRGREAAELRLRLNGRVHARTAEVLGNLALYYATAGRVDEADSSYRECIDVFDQVGARSIFAPLAWMGYANLCRDGGRPERADSLYRRAEAVLDSTNAGTRGYLAQCLVDHASLCAGSGRSDDAESMMGQALVLRRAEGGDDDPALGDLWVAWASVRARSGDATGAVEKLVRAKRCGVAPEALAGHPELAALQGSPGYPYPLIP